jgi:hypothetical protein
VYEPSIADDESEDFRGITRDPDGEDDLQILPPTRTAPNPANYSHGSSYEQRRAYSNEQPPYSAPLLYTSGGYTSDERPGYFLPSGLSRPTDLHH